MNVVLIGPVYPYRGGIAHYTTLLARALLKRCSQLHVVSFQRQYPRWLYPGKSDRDPSQEPLRFEAQYLLDPFYPWTWLQTARQITAWKPDVVIFQWWTTFWAPAYAALAFLLRRQSFKLMFVIHNVLPHETRPWDRWLVRLALRQGHYFLAQTVQEKERLLAILPDACVKVAPHPVYDMFASQRIPKAEAKQRLGLPPGETVALFFGIVRPYKGLRYAVEAVAKLRSRERLVHLVIAGEFWEDIEVYNQLIEKLGLSTHVTIDNRYIPNEEISLYFSAADVFLAPYTGGTQSGAVKMALGFQLPVVLSRSIFSEELASGPAYRIYWVDPKNIETLASSIEDSLNVVEPAALSLDSGSEARTGAYQQENWDKLVSTMENWLG